MIQRPFVVLDRDGTIVIEKVYLSKPDQVELVPGAAAGLKHLREIGLDLVVVTNQSGIGRGLFDRSCLDRIHQRMTDLLAAEGAQIDAIYYCPHLPEDGCTCRKPRPGLIERATGELGLSPVPSFVIGDKPCDVDLGREIGAPSILVRTGYGSQFELAGTVNADYIVDDLPSAARLIESLCYTRSGGFAP
jgi:histidinol-phosphate phosphatase family protein